MDTILQSIQNHIAENLPKIQYVDEDWGQLEYYGAEIPVKWPCVLISDGTANYSNIGKDYRKTPENRQQGKVLIELTVANLKLTNSSFRAPNLQKQQAFGIHHLIKELHEVIHGWKPTENSGALIRVNSINTKRDDGVQQRTIIYSLDVYDC